MLATALLVGVGGTLAQVGAQERLAARLASSPHFVFHSDPRVNLNDHLLEHASADSVEGFAEASCIESLSEDERGGYERALRFYRERLKDASYRGDEMAAVRARLLGRDSPGTGDLVEKILEHLSEARPAYEACFWPEQHLRNRRWIETVLLLIEEHGSAVTERLSRFYQEPWPASPVPVDVVAWGGPGGANTIGEPPHIVISSVNAGYREEAGLEMVYHEASHLLIGPRHGRVSEEIARANGGRPQLPRGDLWHTILFFTTGRTIEAILAAAGRPGYRPYLYERGVIDRAWPFYRKPLEEHWQAYLEGDVELPAAIDRLIDAIHATPRDP